MLHSVPAEAGETGCEATALGPREGLRGHVLGYGIFRSSTGRAVRHRLFPISVTVLIVDFEEAPLVTGPRTTATTDGPTRWGHGVTVGLTPAGVTALLGVPSSLLAGRTLRLPDLLGTRGLEMAERLAELRRFAAPGDARGFGALGGPRGFGALHDARGFAALDDPLRFDALDDLLASWLEPPPPGPDLAMTAWRRLQRSRGRLRVGALAGELGVSRSGLERAFHDRFGQSPGTVARIARFQHALDLIGHGTPLATVAAEGGYADQPHLTREIRALAGLTPASLRPFLARPA